nr:hypothetical protein [Rhodococcus sp. 06-621-2]
MLIRLERGRLPFLITISSSAGLAVLTAVRFFLMIQLLDPSQYGFLNLLATAVNLVPLFLALGLPLHLQKMVRSHGIHTVAAGLRRSYIVCLATAAPGAGVIYAISYPFAESFEEAIVVAVGMTVVCISNAIAILVSQMVLAAGYRAVSSLVMLAINSGLTWTICFPYFLNEPSMQVIVLCWAWGSFATCIAVTVIAVRISHLPGPDALVNMRSSEPETVKTQILDGIRSIPTMIGPWLLVFLIRYIMGLQMGTEAIATFAIASTVVDTAFLISAAIVSFYSNRILDATQSPAKPFLVSCACLCALVLPCIALMPMVLAVLGNQQYTLSIPIVLVLSVAGIARLSITAWRQVTLAQGRLGSLSIFFLGATAIVCIYLLFADPGRLDIYAVVQAASYVVIAVSQVLLVHSGRVRMGPGEDSNIFKNSMRQLNPFRKVRG